jgi:hypothetical protein
MKRIVLIMGEIKNIILSKENKYQRSINIKKIKILKSN